MYQVLYRKWRPQAFADVAGQPQVTVTLKNELQAGRIAHAYLFTGSRGTGKTTCAKILAKAVNCLNSADGDPCGECENCRGIESGAIMDVVEIDAASNNGVENIRNLREEAAFTPASAKYRVYIIDEVHMLSIGAFNALLKTLEEPPAHVVFILATTEVHKLPATVLSRCQRFDFHRIAPSDIAQRLTYVAQQENAELQQDAALLIARIADGALRDALSLLDQCMGRSKIITLDVVSETAGLAGRDHLFELSDAVLRQNGADALAVIDRLHKGSKDMVRLCEELISHFRNIMLLKTMRDPQELIVLSGDEYHRVEEQAGQFSLAETIHVIDTLQSASERMFKGGDRRVEMEMSMIKLCSPELDTTAEAMLRRIAQLERAVRAGTITTESFEGQNVSHAEKTQLPPQKTVPQRSSEEEVPPQEAEEHSSLSSFASQEPDSSQKSETTVGVNMESLQQNAKRMTNWPEVLQVLKGYSQVIASAFNGSVAYLNGEYVLIDAPNSMAFELLRKSAQRDKMRVALKEVTGRVYKLGPYKPPAQTAETQKDPLEELADAAQKAGIPVIKN